MRVLFLDIDGVLVNLDTLRNKDIEQKADPACVAELNRIVNCTDARIVVSSTWRSYGLAKLQEIFCLWGIERRIHGFTPQLDVMYGNDNGLAPGFPRSREISIWLSLSPLKTESYAILDDEHIEGHGDRLIQTQFEKGLTFNKADQAIELLMRRM